MATLAPPSVEVNQGAPALQSIAHSGGRGGTCITRPPTSPEREFATVSHAFP
eukprot:CAMPEP_0176296022 /NCGR_PEP_ID=MMETSP0121_2-20121125/57974_1 /TAXON_ID=160619 /ORGANISM="Kryptoperidinium foliaceum, Strain CCMP 1326" /LENGTH=51 /DNA_ID=CAMNT_0017637131 /DNA_START=24 /DNA_END=176 /DNA_ORIENTATION=+